MARPLPSCPHCGLSGTLEAVGLEPREVIVARCSHCEKRCRVSPSGRVIHPVPEVDVNGTVIDGP
jgi:hypothetical protein